MKYLTKLAEAIAENYDSIENECEDTNGNLYVIISDSSTGVVSHYNIGDPNQLTRIGGYILSKNPTEASRWEESIWLSDNVFKNAPGSTDRADEERSKMVDKLLNDSNDGKN